MSEFPQTRDTPGGGMEVLDSDGVWRTVPWALQQYLRSFKPAPGFASWEWMIGQVYAAGLMPVSALNAKPEDERAAREFMYACEARFPEQCKKFADYMGWKRSDQKQ